jgi:hypothetical protein
MKKNLILVLIMMLAKFLSAQINLVPNPSFELYDSCPKGNGDLFCTPWYGPTDNTPDYLNACWNGVTTDTMDVPINRFGSQYARTGVAYAGVFCLYASVNARDYISVKLTDTLEIGQQYDVEFYVSLADSSWGGIDNLAAHLSSTPDTMYAGFSITNLPFQPQIFCDTIIKDTSAWTRIHGSLVASGGECYITIGVFLPDSLLSYDAIQGDGSVRASYYYIDDVSVVKYQPPMYSAITLFPNPSNGEFTVTGNLPEHTQLFVYDMLGQKVMESPYLPVGNTSVPVHLQLSQGVYYYELRSTETLATGKLMIVK